MIKRKSWRALNTLGPLTIEIEAASISIDLMHASADKVISRRFQLFRTAQTFNQNLINFFNYKSPLKLLHFSIII